ALTSKGVRVVEFNARFGDPETQVVLDRLATPLATLLQSCAVGGLDPAFRLEWHPGAAVAVVLAAQGYPAAPVKGDGILGVEGASVRHAGTKLHEQGRLPANGGRVVKAAGLREDVPAARAAASATATKSTLRACHHRIHIAAL